VRSVSIVASKANDRRVFRHVSGEDDRNPRYNIAPTQLPVIETLYKTSVPEQMTRAEYYQPHIEPKFHQGKWFLVVTETHAWYDGEEKDAKLQVTTLDPQATEGFANLEEVWRRYNEQSI
jgi:hypothetical protein